MKKLTILLSSLLISINSYSGIFNEKNHCFETDGQNIVFLPNETNPYTGTYLCKFDNGQKEEREDTKTANLMINGLFGMRVVRKNQRQVTKTEN